MSLTKLWKLKSCKQTLGFPEKIPPLSVLMSFPSTAEGPTQKNNLLGFWVLSHPWEAVFCTVKWLANKISFFAVAVLNFPAALAFHHQSSTKNQLTSEKIGQTFLDKQKWKQMLRLEWRLFPSALGQNETPLTCKQGVALELNQFFHPVSKRRHFIDYPSAVCM